MGQQQNINVNLSFSADITKAKASLQDLQNQLTRLSQMPNSAVKELGITKELNQATTAAAQLQSILSQSTNMKTGLLDLNKFSNSLKSSGTTLKGYRDMLTSLGTEGDKAFMSLTTSIMQAEIPAKKVNSRLLDLKNTLMNTARWQLSSSIVHGFMGAVQEAYGYAQDLNESLNNIRIVTRYNVDKMAQFAEEANKAAKALSTTTTQYTDASLIYYQQGLNDQQVKERTDVTIKMANVARESAQTVSDEMTAVWNNFYDGSKSLEYYADVLTALGAATASSTAEISQGLEKFAAISNTVGLSYEYASTALATVTAETRQSADIVGTAFKTMFARIQGLELGETLEDGTNLNQYSQALEKVGINIKDQNGDLKEMDDILNEMGSKWETLSEDEQVALAQKVAGIRQYSQLIALMENWDKFQINLGTAQGAEGTLQEQADIYAESWEAARDRVTASLETIYKKLLDDKAFIKILDGFEKILDVLSLVIDNLGGLKGVLLLAGNIALKAFGPELAKSIDGLGDKFKRMTGQVQSDTKKIKLEAANLMKNLGTDMDTSAGRAMSDLYEGQSNAQTEIINNASRMNDLERQTVAILLDGHKILGEQAIAQGKIADQAERELAIKTQGITSGNQKNARSIDYDVTRLKSLGQAETQIKSLKERIAMVKGETEEVPQVVASAIGRTLERLEVLPNITNNLKGKIAELKEEFSNIKVKDDGTLDLTKEQIENLTEQFEKLSTQIKNVETRAKKRLIDQGTSEEDKQALGGIAEEAKQTGIQIEQAAQKTDTLKVAEENIGRFANNIKGKLKTTGEKIVDFSSALSSLAMSISMIDGMVKTLSDPDVSGWEKFLSVITTLGMVVPQVVSSINKLTPVIKAVETGGAAAGAGLKEGAKGASALVTSLSTSLGPILLVIAAIGALVSAGVLIYKSMHKNALEAEKAAKVADDLAESASNAAQAVQDLKSAFDGYDSAIKTLNDCVKGTSEWNDALQNVNDQAMDLIEKYPELMKMQGAISVDSSTGQIKIDEEAKQQVLESKQQERSSTLYASQMAQIDSDRKNISASLEDIFNQVKFDRSTPVISESGETSKLGNIIDDNLELLANLPAEDFISTLESIIKQQGQWDSKIGKEINKLKDYNNEISQLANQAKAIDNELENTANLIAQQNLDSKKYSSAEIEIASETYEKRYLEIYNQYMEKGTKGVSAAALNSNKNVTELIKKYNEATGQYYTLAKGGVKGTDKNRTFTFNEKEEEVTLEEISNTIAAAEALKELTGSADNAKQVLSEFKNQSAIDFINALTNGTDKFSIADFFASKFTEQDLDNIQLDENGELTQKSLEQLGVSAEQFQEIAELYGIETSKLIENIVAAKNNIKDEFKKDSGKFGLVSQKDLTVQQRRNFLSARESSISNVEANLGVSTDYQTMIQQNADLGAIKLTEFMGKLSELSLTSEDSSEQLEDLIKQYGLTGSAAQRFQQEIDSLEKTYAVTTKDITDEKAELDKIISKVDSSTITEEELQTLQEAGINTSDYFTAMADGTYSLTADAEEFKRIVESITIEKLRGQIEDYSNSREQIASKYAVAGVTQEQLIQANTGDNTLGKAQIDYLKSFEDLNFSKIVGSGDILNIDTSKQIELTADQLSTINEMIAQVNLSEIQAQEQFLNTANSFTELKLRIDELGTVSTEVLSGALISLGNQYENCINEVDNYVKALERGNEAEIEEAQTALETSIIIGEKAKKYDLDAEALEIQIKLLQNNNKYQKLSAQETANLAVANQRMNKGVKTLNENWENWSKVLKKADKTSMDYADTLVDTHKALADLTGVTDAALIPVDFLDNSTESGAKHLQWLEEAANGNVDAINKLGAAMAQCTVEAMEFDATMAQSAIDAGLIDEAFDLTAFENYRLEVLEGITALQQELENGTIAAGQNITSLMDGTGQSWVDSLNAMAMATGMGVEEMNSLLNQLGVQAKVNVTEVPQKMSVPTYTEVVEPNEITVYNSEGEPETRHGWTHYTVPGPSKEVDGVVQVAQISTEDSDLDVPQITYTGTGGSLSGGGVSPSSTGSGSGKGSSSKPTKKQLTKKSEVVDRYKEVTDSLDDLTRKLDKANEKTDRLFGPAKIKNLKKTNTLLKEQVGLIEQQIKEAKGYLKTDKNQVNKLAGQLGLDFNYDKQGNITNYTPEMTKLYEQLNQTEKTYNSIKNKDKQDKYNEEVLQPLEEKIKALQEALGQYEETRELIQDLTKEQEEISLEIDTNEMKIITYTVEVQVDAAESEIEYVNYLLSEMEDTAYDAAQAIALLDKRLEALGTESSAITTGYEDLFKQKLSDKEVNLVMSGQANKIDWSKFQDDEDYEEWMNNLKSYAQQALQNNQALIDTQHEVNSQLTKTFESWVEEYDKGLAVFDHADRVYEGYTNIIDLLGNRSGISDKRKQQINQARVDNANNKLGASKDKLDDIKRDRTKTEGLLAKSKKGLENAKTDEEKKFWQRQIKDQEEALEKIKEEEQKAEEEYLQDWQSALETARDAFLANSEIQLKAFEKKMAGTYGSFEEMQNAFDKQSTKRKEYLQDYQKIYELNKLNRDLTKKLDETSNVKAKQALMEMQEEILKYQKDGVKMSEYDLEYLQKKYDLRVAEIALEEAQNAKTQVRLTRDSSGNYSYTYTTDENQTAEMAQTYEDKLNDLITLSNDYVEQQTSNLLSTQQEFVDTIAAINQKAAEGYFETDEAYQQALEETREYYQGRMEYFSSEIDKASKNNINVYQNEYSQYEGFIGGKIAIDHAHSEALNEEAQRAKDRYIALAKEYESQKAELTKQWQVDHTLSKEEYDKAITQLDEEFSGQIAQAKQDIETANSGIITNFTDTFLPQLEDKYSTAKSYVKDWSKKVGTVDGEKKTGVLGKMSTSYDNLVKNINTAMGNAGTSMDTFKTSVYNALLSDSKKNDSVKTISDATRDSLKELAKSADFSDAITNVKNWQKENATSLSAIIAKNNEAIKSYTDLASEISKQNKTGKKPKKDTTSQEPDTSKNDDKDDKDDKDDDTPGTVNNSKKIPGVAAAIWIKGPDTSGWGTGATRRKRLKAKGVEGAQEYINQHGENGDIYNDWNTKRDKLKNYYYGAFATGGYTGEWGSEGKLAVLHEKELVLNKEDTKNMLDIISVVRTMIDSLDFQSRLSNLASLSLINNTSLPSMNKDESVNQTVNITAEFPAATDRHEIEQAFNLLKNKASQYVNKK